MRFWKQFTIFATTTFAAIMLIKEELEFLGWPIIFFNAGWLLGMIEKFVEDRAEKT